MSSFKFIKPHKSVISSISNNQVPFDNNSRLKNIENFNNAPAQPAQSFNILDQKINPSQQKKGFGFIKKKPNNNSNNNLEQSNASVTSNEQKISGNNLYNAENDLNNLINNTNELLNFGTIQKNEDNLNNSNNNNKNSNININNLGEATYQNFRNVDEDNISKTKKESFFNNNQNFLNSDFSANSNNNNNYEEREKPLENLKEKKSGFSFLNRNKKKNINNNIAYSSESDSNKNVPYIANKTPLSSSMSDKLSDKGGNQNVNQGNMNINQAAAETEKDLIENNNYYMDMNSLNNSNSNNNINIYETTNNVKKEETLTPGKKEEIKEKTISEISIKSKYKLKKDNYIDDYIKYINELHIKKLVLQNKESELSSLNIEKENLIKEEQKAIDDNDYEKADNIENKIKDIKNKSCQILLKIEEETNLLMVIKKKEIQINNNLLLDIDEVSSGYNTLKEKLEEKIENFNTNEIAKHEGENIRLEKLKEKLEFLKSNLEQEKAIIDTEESKIDKLIKGQSAGIFESLENLISKKK